MADKSPRSAKLHHVLLVVLGLIYVGWAAIFIAHSAIETSHGRYFCLFDDAMVSLRYAWNLAHGHGLVWNPGERVEGTTSFLLTIYMTLGALFLSKSEAALFVQITGIPLVLGVAVMAQRLGRSLGATRYLGLITAAAVLAYYPLSYWSLMGMETGLLAALAMAALLVAMRLGSDPHGSKLLGLLLGLMSTTRPDAAVPAAVILAFRAAWILLGHRTNEAEPSPAESGVEGSANPPTVRRSYRRLAALGLWLPEVTVFAGIVLGLTLFRLVYYGSPVPNTYQLKMADWPLHWRLHNGWKFVVPFLDTSRHLILLALCSALFQRDGRRLLLLCFAGSVIACQIWVGGDAWSYWRMLVPGVVALIVLAVDGCSYLARWVARPRWQTRKGVAGGPAQVPSTGSFHTRALVLGFGLAGSGWALWAADEPFMDELRMKIPAYGVLSNQSTVEDGIRLSHYADSQASVAVFAAGALPYYSGLRGVDALGKSDRYVARLPGRAFDSGETVTPGHNKYDLRYSIEKLRPDAIYDALAWARYEGGDIYEFVRSNYVQRGPFWLRRDSPYVHWDRLPPQ
jgi:hypothetical protein